MKTVQQFIVTQGPIQIYAVFTQGINRFPKSFLDFPQKSIVLAVIFVYKKLVLPY